MQAAYMTYGSVNEYVIWENVGMYAKAQLLGDRLPEKVLTKLRDVVWRWSKSALVEVLPDGRLKKSTRQE